MGKRFQAAARWVVANPRVSNECVRVQVNPMAPADVANVLAARAGGLINVAAGPVPTPTDAEVPAAWIPDSVSWLGRVQAVNRDAFDPEVEFAMVDWPEGWALEAGKVVGLALYWDIAKALEAAGLRE